jgi:hypothetical protein
MKLTIDAANQTKSNLLIGSLDIHKAFDKVPWQGVVNGMRRIMIPENIIKLLTTIQFNRTLSVMTAHGETDSFIPIIGNPQGCSLSPLYWNILCDPLLGVLQKETEDHYCMLYN